jgi:hypothetical protein
VDAPDELMCATCHRPLDVVTNDAGEMVDYWHASNIVHGPPHDPIPTLRIEGLASIVCDFCCAPEAGWRYPARTFDSRDLALVDIALKRPFAQNGGSMTPRSVGDWCACDACHEDIQRNRWDAIADRNLRGKPRFIRRELRPEIRRLHRQFQANRTGDPRRIHG